LTDVLSEKIFDRACVSTARPCRQLRDISHCRDVPCLSLPIPLTRMSSQPASVLDLEAIANLRALGDEGDDTFLREIISIYLEDVPQRIVDLKSARAAGDKALYVRSAHTIKGSSANVGATEMRNLAEKMEHRAKIEPLPGLDPDLLELETAFGRTVAALRTLLG
jgi:histidine phosphotransfer protein HptB